MFEIDSLNFEDARYEKKFVILNSDIKDVESIIRLHPAMFSKIFYKRKVNNIYFDSVNMKNYHEHLSGIPRRLKIRIRWYGKTFGLIKKPVLEIKIKNNQIGKKLSFQLASFKLDKDFSLDFLYERILSDSNLPGFVRELLKGNIPVLLNNYMRDYFVSAGKKYRLTLDSDLKFFWINPKNNLFYGKIDDFPIAVLELKYSQKGDDFADKIANYFPFRLSANSKYLQGIDLLRL